MDERMLKRDTRGVRRDRARHLAGGRRAGSASDVLMTRNVRATSYLYTSRLPTMQAVEM